jgi:NAD(P)-dependent dehydrogenase (short-subunit alcohol dehydrogenase family)
MSMNKTKDHACIVINASIAGIYPVRFNPIYSAAKHGVVGWARSISKTFYEEKGIRVNTICPANVRTGFFTPEQLAVFKMEWIEVLQIVSIVEMLLLDRSLQGKLCEVAPKTHYFIEAPTYHDDNVRIALEDSQI